MILDLRQFEAFPVHVSLEAPLGLPQIDFAGARNVRNARLDVTIAKSGEEYFCQGQVRAEVTLVCSRCLEDFQSTLVNGADFIVCSQEQRAKNKDAVDDEDYVYFKGNDLQVDVSDIVRQAVILAVGMKPLCSQGCRGICPRCGKNLNQEACLCNARQFDERWNDLRRISGR